MMNFTARRSRWRSLIPLLSLFVVSACTTTTVSVDRMARANSENWWRVRNSLPVVIHGDVPGLSPIALASQFPSQAAETTSVGLSVPKDRQVNLYLNATALPVSVELCSEPQKFVAGPQTGDRATVVAALCRGNRVVSKSRGSIVASGRSAPEVKAALKPIIDALFIALNPGASHNDPDYGWN